MLAPMIERAQPWSDSETLVTADAGYHSDANVQQLHDNVTPTLSADGQMRKRYERFEGRDKHKAKPDPLSDKKASGAPTEIKFFRPKDFNFNGEDNTATCPERQVSSRYRSVHLSASGHPYQTYIAQASDCAACALRGQCLKKRRSKMDDKKAATNEQAPQVARVFPRLMDFSHPSELMRQAIDSPRGRQVYSQRIGTVEPVFANLRNNKRLNRLNLRGQARRQ
ncbi:transposase [Paucibacter sp. AS339]|uniref:transposase n=1 Tax=Paucibacter hankyongi TaxID=3133434 RepID=UPI0030A8C41E